MGPIKVLSLIFKVTDIAILVSIISNIKILYYDRYLITFADTIIGKVHNWIKQSDCIYQYIFSLCCFKRKKKKKKLNLQKATEDLNRTDTTERRAGSYIFQLD